MRSAINNRPMRMLNDIDFVARNQVFCAHTCIEQVVAKIALQERKNGHSSPPYNTSWDQHDQ
jgi:hypothetical protein